MANSGTLLSDLDSKGTAPNDQDLVRKIFMEMESNGSANQQNPVLSGQGMIPMISSPNPNTTAPIAMDPAPPTSHLIGKDHPTPADFAAAMHGVMRPPEAQMAPMAGNWGQFAGPMNGQPTAPMPVPIPESPKMNIYSRIAEEMKTPLLVTLLLFVFSLPAIHVLFSHYLPNLVKASGDLTTIGLLVKAVLGGATFWTLQRVVAPLVAL
jgi:hypothetical protein